MTHPTPDQEFLDKLFNRLLRDYFAAQAMQGMLSNPHSPVGFSMQDIASSSYQLADIMLAVRGQK